eukprot:Skav233940  [mRNA]  locus=scaffold5884:5582:6001:+ [translate_table: standard]
MNSTPRPPQPVQPPLWTGKSINSVNSCVLNAVRNTICNDKGCVLKALENTSCNILQSFLGLLIGHSTNKILASSGCGPFNFCQKTLNIRSGRISNGIHGEPGRLRQALICNICCCISSVSDGLLHAGIGCIEKSMGSIW